MRKKHWQKKLLAVWLSFSMVLGSVGMPSFADGNGGAVRATPYYPIKDISITNLASNYTFNEKLATPGAINLKKPKCQFDLKLKEEQEIKSITYQVYEGAKVDPNKIQYSEELVTGGAIKTKVDFQHTSKEGLDKKQMVRFTISSNDEPSQTMSYTYTLRPTLIKKAPILDNLSIEDPAETKPFTFSQSVYKYQLEVNHDDLIYFIPSFDEAGEDGSESDDVRYSISGEEEQDIPLESGEKIQIPSMKGEETKELTIKVKSANLFFYKDIESVYTITLKRVKQPATVSNIELSGKQLGGFTFDPSNRGPYAINTGDLVTFHVTPRVGDLISYNIDGGETIIPKENTFSIEVPEGTTVPVTLHITPNEADGSYIEGTYVFQFANKGMSVQDEMDWAASLMSSAVEANIFWEKNPVFYKATSNPWKSMNIAAFGYGNYLDLGEFQKALKERVMINLMSVQDSFAFRSMGVSYAELKQGIDLGGGYQFQNSIESANGFRGLWLASDPTYRQILLEGNPTALKDGLNEAIKPFSNGSGQYPNGQLAEGAINGIDGTGMILAGLAPYYGEEGYEDVTAAIEKALDYLKGQFQKETGYFLFNGEANCESASMVIIALCALGIDPNNAEGFITNDGLGLIDVMERDYLNDNGFFTHIPKFINQTTDTSFAAEQGMRAMAAYLGYLQNGKKPFHSYDISSYPVSPMVSLPKTLEDIRIAGTIEKLAFNPYQRVYPNGKCNMNITNENGEQIKQSKTQPSMTLPYDEDKAIFSVSRKGNETVCYLLNGGSQVPVTFDEGKATAVFTIDDIKVDKSGEANKVTIFVYPSPDMDDVNESGIAYNAGKYTFYVARLEKDKDFEVNKAYVSLALDTKQESNFDFDFHLSKVEIKERDTVWDVLKSALDQQDLVYKTTGSGSAIYLAQIGPDEKHLLGEFTASTQKDGWMYGVTSKGEKNEVIPQVGINAYELSDGDKIRVFYTKDYSKETTSWKGVVEEKAQEFADRVMVMVSASVKSDGKGNLTASVHAKEIETALEKALKAAKEKGTDAKAEVKIQVKPESKETVKSVEMSISMSAILELGKNTNTLLTIVTPLATMTMDGKVAAMAGKEGKGNNLKLKIAQVEKGDVTALPKSTIWDGPIYDFTVMSDGNQVTKVENGKVKISIPYELKKDEKPQNIQVFYIDDKGKFMPVKDGKYDEEAKEVTFTTDHFSYYTIGQEKTKKGFHDVNEVDWFFEDVCYLSDLGIIKGKTETDFLPKDTITRAEFVQLLLVLGTYLKTVEWEGLQDENTSTKGAITFKDVPRDAWYAQAVSWAQQNDIVVGNGDLFSPMEQITRQDMAVMMHRYIYDSANIILNDKNKGVSFADEEQIADYAKEAVLQMQELGILNGIPSGTEKSITYEFQPRNNATRAESAKMISVLLKEVEMIVQNKGR